MEIRSVVACSLAASSVLLLSYLYWRHIWFFRNPSRTSPEGGRILSPADGTVVYVENVLPHEEVIVIKQGMAAAINDIVGEDLAVPKILIGIFMSPFDVHYNRAPLSGRVDYIRHHPAKTRNIHMGPMHLRTLFKLPPYSRNSLHILQNERVVTRINGVYEAASLHCYVIQIAGGSVNGIDLYIENGDRVEKGEIFGMIRIGSQVDLVLPAMPDMRIRVRPGDRVRAGETVLID